MEWPSDTVSTINTLYRAAQASEEVRCSPGRENPRNPIDEDHEDYERNDCAEGTYMPFGTEISNENFLNGNMIVEGWYIDSVPYRDGQTEDDRHQLQVEQCNAYQFFGQRLVFCNWVDV